MHSCASHFLCKNEDICMRLLYRYIEKKKQPQDDTSDDWHRSYTVFNEIDVHLISNYSSHSKEKPIALKSLRAKRLYISDLVSKMKLNLKYISKVYSRTLTNTKVQILYEAALKTMMKNICHILGFKFIHSFIV